MKFHLHHTADIWAQSSAQVDYLFNEANHLFLQSASHWHLFEYRDSKEECYARISFHIKSGVARSPLRAPFGSVEIHKKLDEAQLTTFVELVQSELIRLRVKQIIIRSFPDMYDNRTTHLIHTVFRKLRFATETEVSSVIPIDDKPFNKKIKVSERQKSKKSEALFHFEQWPSDDVQKIYSFIAKCRAERNQSLSMTLRELQKTMAIFPDRFFLFTVGTKTELAAAAIVIQVSKKILYTFYYAHVKKHNRFSPVVFLISGIYNFGFRKHLKMIDLGTSMLDGQVNRSLLHFKKSIGGVTNRKFTFHKTLS